MNVNEILDLLEVEEIHNVEEIIINPPGGDDSDGYDDSDTEEGVAASLSRPVLSTEVLEIRTGGADAVLELLAEEDEQEVVDQVQMSPPRKKVREQWDWEEEARVFSSRKAAIFPEGNYTIYAKKSPKELVELFIDDDLLEQMAKSSNEYALASGEESTNITPQEIRTFLSILLLSGYNSPCSLRQFWSNSEDTQNMLVKKAVSRNRFLLIKKSFHLAVEEQGEQVDRYKKVRVLVKHMQNKFSEHFVPEQNLSHDEAMIKYFGKSSLKQAIRNKPIRFGFKAWLLCTPSGYVVVFDLYQGKGIGINSTPNVKAV